MMFLRGLSIIETGKYYKYVNQQGRVFSGKWVEANPFYDGMAIVRQKKSGYGYIDNSGKLVIPYSFAYAENFSEGLAVVANEDGYYGYVDKTGKMPIGFQFESAGSFYEDRALVRKDTEEYYIDRTGKRIN